MRASNRVEGSGGRPDPLDTDSTRATRPRSATAETTHRVVRRLRTREETRRRRIPVAACGMPARGRAGRGGARSATAGPREPPATCRAGLRCSSRGAPSRPGLHFGAADHVVHVATPGSSVSCDSATIPMRPEGVGAPVRTRSRDTAPWVSPNSRLPRALCRLSGHRERGIAMSGSRLLHTAPATPG